MSRMSRPKGFIATQLAGAILVSVGADNYHSQPLAAWCAVVVGMVMHGSSNYLEGLWVEGRRHER